MKHSLYDKSRLTSVNVLGYISEQYPKSKMINKEKEKMLNITSFQQSLFGKKGDGDCTLVSLMTCLYYYLKEEIDKTLLYDAIRSKAEKRFFSEKIGLLPFFTLGLYKKLLKQFSLKHSAKSAWFKGIGYNFNTIKKCIDNNFDLDIHYNLLTKENALKIEKARLKLNVWTVDDINWIESHKDYKIDFITSNILE
jgi:hypothetical protein